MTSKHQTKKHQLKKSQLSIFFAVGIVIVIIGITAIQLNKPAHIEQTEDFLPVTALVNFCLEQTLKEGIEFIGLQGGYYQPKNFLAFESHQVPFYVRSNQIVMPTIQSIEEELGMYIEDHLPSCVDNFESISTFGYRVNQLSPQIIPTIGENGISVRAYYPLTISKAEEEIRIDRFSASSSLDFKDIFNIIEEFMREQQKDIEAVHYGHLAKSAYDNNFFFEITQINRQTLVYSIKFNESQVPFTFNFAAQYNW